MLNRINRFVRNVESKYDCDEDNLIIETAVYVPERVASKTNIPWKTIFNHISSYITYPEDKGIRSLDSVEFGIIRPNATRLFSLSYTDSSNEPKILSTYLSVDKITGISFITDDSLSTISSSTAKIGVQINHKFGPTINNISAETVISNLIRDVRISGVSISGDNSHISAAIALSVNGSSTGLINSNTHEIAGIGIKSIDNLTVREGTDGIQNIELGYHTNNSNISSSVSANLSVTKLTGFTLTGPDSNKSTSSTSAGVSANIGYVYGGTASSLTSETNISNLIRSLSVDSLNLYLDENENTLCADLSYTANTNKNSISTNVINLSAYKSAIEEDPVFWQAERTVRTISSTALISTEINKIELSTGREQSYEWTGNNGTLSLYIPPASINRSGELVLYLEERPEDDPSKVFVLSGTNIKTLPTRRPWTLSNGIWKLEFDSIPGSTNWRYIQSTRYKFDD